MQPLTDPAPPVPPPTPPPSRERRNVNVLVVYGSRFGNTQRLAEALTRGLRSVPGVSVDLLPVTAAVPRDLSKYDLLAVGGPTEIFSATPPMKEFLARLSPEALRGKRGFAFDTRLDGPFYGSAGKYLEKHLARLGVVMVRPHASGIVRSMTREEGTLYGTEGAPEWARRFDPGHPPHPSGPVDLLAPGAVGAFERIGAELGAQLLGPGPIPA